MIFFRPSFARRSGLREGGKPVSTPDQVGGRHFRDHGQIRRWFLTGPKVERSRVAAKRRSRQSAEGAVATAFGRQDGSIRHDGAPVANLFRRFLNDCSGSTAVEYGLIAAAVACFIVGSVQKLGTNLKNNFSSLQNAVK
jgi:pilus assembly protein Flp/PilA